MVSEYLTQSAAETEALAARLARQLKPGDVVTLSGELGSGKTTFIRGACRELGIESAVTSPTFVIGQLYSGRVKVAHVDLYRIGDINREDPALLADYTGPGLITFIEWPAAADNLLRSARMTVDFELVGLEKRKLSVWLPERSEG